MSYYKISLCNNRFIPSLCIFVSNRRRWFGLLFVLLTFVIISLWRKTSCPSLKRKLEYLFLILCWWNITFFLLPIALRWLLILFLFFTNPMDISKLFIWCRILLEGRRRGVITNLMLFHLYEGSLSVWVSCLGNLVLFI